MRFLEEIALRRAEEQMHTPKSYKAREGKRRGPPSCCPLCDEKLGGKTAVVQGRRVHERCVTMSTNVDAFKLDSKEKIDGYDLDG